MQPYALFIRGEEKAVFNIAERLGFAEDMEALALSVFEDGPDTMQVQALFATETEALATQSSLNLSPDFESFVVQLDDEDWVSKSQKGLPPVDAGRFWVYGSHDADSIPAHVTWPIHIDAGQAFGTGHHGTTKGCLITFDKLLQSGFDPKDVLDLGCGAGILAIAAAKALGRTVLATDIDPDAVAVTKENADINAVAPHIISEVSNGFESAILKDRQFNLIFANILAGPLMGLAPDITKALAPGGRVILSGILDEQAATVAASFEKAGLSVSPQPSLSGWTSLLASKL